MTDSNAHFRSVLRGYDPAQVDQHVQELAQAAAAARQEAGERTIEVSKLEAAHTQLRGEVERHVQRAQALEEAQAKAAAPTYASPSAPTCVRSLPARAPPAAYPR